MPGGIASYFAERLNQQVSKVNSVFKDMVYLNIRLTKQITCGIWYTTPTFCSVTAVNSVFHKLSVKMEKKDCYCLLALFCQRPPCSASLLKEVKLPKPASSPSVSSLAWHFSLVQSFLSSGSSRYLLVSLHHTQFCFHTLRVHKNK